MQQPYKNFYLSKLTFAEKQVKPSTWLWSFKQIEALLTFVGFAADLCGFSQHHAYLINWNL